MQGPMAAISASRTSWRRCATTHGLEQTWTPSSDMLADSSTYLEMGIAVPLELTRIEIFHFKAPINEPIITSFGSIPARNALLVRIEDKGGAFGWGEVWANF